MFRNSSRPVIMGILNVTPNSFSDGGKFATVEDALKQAKLMFAEGAGLLDIGGESTRPESDAVPAEEQIKRVIPVIKEIRKELPEHLVISIDTTLSVVAEAALNAGANMINDISAGRHDPDIFNIAASRNVPVILMHMQGTPKTMQDNPHYESVVDEVLGFLLERIDGALQAGVKKKNIIIDPGIGFGKRKRDNIDLLANLNRFVETGFPVLLGASRKRFMGSICNVSRPSELVTPTAVTTAVAIMQGVQVFRVHDVKDNRQAADVALAIKQAGNF